MKIATKYTKNTEVRNTFCVFCALCGHLSNTLVAANRELTTRFEKKIQTTLARIWGEEAPAAAEA